MLVMLSGINCLCHPAAEENNGLLVLSKWLGLRNIYWITKAFFGPNGYEVLVKSGQCWRCDHFNAEGSIVRTKCSDAANGPGKVTS